MQIRILWKSAREAGSGRASAWRLRGNEESAILATRDATLQFMEF